MSSHHTALGGTFLIDGTMPVQRLGFGAMRITGDGVWGPPKDIVESKNVLRRVVELGINFIDTADSYGPHISEELIADSLYPYATGLIVATKGGLTRAGPNIWVPVGRPEYLRQCVHMSLRRLKLDRLPLWQLHRIDNKVPRDEQFSAIAQMQQQGLIDRIGLSEVSVEDIQEAQKFFRVSTVQNLYNFENRQSEAVVEYCTAQNIGFIPWYPLAAGKLSAATPKNQALCEKYRATPSQLALAWVLGRSTVMLPIPGTSKVSHLEENVKAANVALDTADFQQMSML